MKRHVFFISDGTGITAVSLGNSLLSQFEAIAFEKQSIPYVDTLEKANSLINEFNDIYNHTHIKPIVFMTIVNPEISLSIKQSHACIFDLLNTFLTPLEKELNAKSSYTVGRAHGVVNTASYDQRIGAINFALAHDDGLKTKGYEHAEIILVGVSRCGKTPTCLYMALQFGIFAANYPFTDDDLLGFKLPDPLKPFKHKLFGLTIDPSRLCQIRSERKPNSRYATLEQCKQEIAAIESMYQQENIPFLNSTRFSIEEISTKIMAITKMKRRI